MEIKVGDRVSIHCRNSAYDGIVGIVYEIQQQSRYAIVLLPVGTERRIEMIGANTIRAQRAGSEKKAPIPPGDPQWFPLEWLVLENDDTKP